MEQTEARAAASPVADGRRALTGKASSAWLHCSRRRCGHLAMLPAEHSSRHRNRRCLCTVGRARAGRGRAGQAARAKRRTSVLPAGMTSRIRGCGAWLPAICSALNLLPLRYTAGPAFCVTRCRDMLREQRRTAPALRRPSIPSLTVSRDTHAGLLSLQSWCCCISCICTARHSAPALPYCVQGENMRRV